MSFQINNDFLSWHFDLLFEESDARFLKTLNVKANVKLKINVKIEDL